MLPKLPRPDALEERHFVVPKPKAKPSDESKVSKDLPVLQPRRQVSGAILVGGRMLELRELLRPLRVRHAVRENVPERADDTPPSAFRGASANVVDVSVLGVHRAEIFPVLRGKRLQVMAHEPNAEGGVDAHLLVASSSMRWTFAMTVA